MKYKSLLKIWYASQDEWEKTCESRMHGESTKYLDFIISGNPAFYVVTEEMLNLCSSIYKNNGFVGKLLSDLPQVAVKQFERRCLIDEIFLTNDIEGVRSTRKDINKAVEGNKKGKQDLRFAGIVAELQKLTEMAGSISYTNCADIRSLYDDIVSDEVEKEDPENKLDGKIFRKGPVSLTTVTQKEIHRGIVPEEKIIECMDKALGILNDDGIEVLIRISIFHYLFGYIHPFYNGNGRVNRFISSSLLAENLNHLMAVRLSYTVKENIKEYNNGFTICNDERNKGDVTPFVIMFLEVINTAVQQLADALKKRLLAMNRYEKILSENQKLSVKEKTVLYILAQVSLFAEHGITIDEVADATLYSAATTRRWITELQEKKLIKIEKDGRKNLFSADLDAIRNL